VRKEQERTKDKYVDITGLDIPVKSRQRVAVSGNTGSSAGPHLHLEIRNSADTSAGNIMLYNPQKYFPVEDSIAPKFYAIGVYGGNVDYHFTETLPDTLFVRTGSYGFGLSALDSMNDEPFHYGLYRLCFMINEDTLSYYSFDSISLEMASKIALHTDNDFYGKYGKRMEKSFVEPQNAVYSPYSIINNNGICFLLPDAVYLLTITGSDYNGNTTVLRQWIRTYEQ
jgi:hypothetical protein